MACEWYHAVCDRCKEYCTVFVDSPQRTDLYLSEKGMDIKAWLNSHFGCELRFIHRDDQLEILYDKYMNMDKLMIKNDEFVENYDRLWAERKSKAQKSK